MRLPSLIVLTVAVVSSIATSREPLEPTTSSAGRVHLYNASDEPIQVTVRLAVEPNCDAVEQAPWLASGLSFEDSTMVLDLPAQTMLPLVEEGMSVTDVDTGFDGNFDTGLDALGCYVAEVELGDLRTVIVVRSDLPMNSYSVDPLSIEDVGYGVVAIHPNGPEVFVDGDLDVLKGEEAPVCLDIDLPTWSLLEPGDRMVRSIERSDACTHITFDEETLQLCGFDDVPLQVGDSVRVLATKAALELDVFAGPRLAAGADLTRLSSDFRVESAGECVGRAACGGFVGAEVSLLDEVFPVGEAQTLGAGVLTILQASAPLDLGCTTTSQFVYIER